MGPLLHLPLPTFLSEGRVLDPTLGSPSRSLLSRFFLDGDRHDLLWDWLSGLSTANHLYVLHGHTIWVDGGGVPLPVRQAVSSAGDHVSWLRLWWWHCISSGSQLGHCIGSDTNQKNLGSRFCYNEAWRCWPIIVNSSSGGNWKQWIFIFKFTLCTLQYI